nr:hypothetical protein [Treponema sp.]
MKKIFISIITILFISVSCKNQSAAVTPEQLCLDIQRIQIDLAFSSMKEFYDPEPFEQLKQEVQEGKVNRLDCVYRIKKIISNFHIVHLNLNQVPSEPADYLYSPIIFRCFGNDYYVIGTVARYNRYKGWKVKEIGGVPVEQAGDRLLEFMSYETKAGAKYWFTMQPTYNNFKYAGLIDKNNKTTFLLESSQGKQKKLCCSFVSNKTTTWSGLMLKKQNPYSPYFVSQNYELKPCPEKRTIYIPYNKCQGIADYPVTALISDLMKELETGSYDTVVFDIRLNSGGEQPVTNIFRHQLYDHKEELAKYNMAIVIGGRTYSAACWFLNNFLDVFPDATVFGEETGQAVFNYTMVMPYRLHYLSCDFMFPQIVDDLPVLKARAKDIYRGTFPDVEIQERFEDYIQGEDTIYNSIYAYYN